MERGIFTATMTHHNLMLTASNDAKLWYFWQRHKRFSKLWWKVPQLKNAGGHFSGTSMVLIVTGPQNYTAVGWRDHLSVASVAHLWGGPDTHTHTQKEEKQKWGWWETPVARWLYLCQRWTNRLQLLTCQIYECYSSSVCVCVCVFLLGLPLAKPSLLHLYFLRSPSLSLSHSLSVEGLMSSLTSLGPPWCSHEQWEKRKSEGSRVCMPSLISPSPWEHKKPWTTERDK